MQSAIEGATSEAPSEVTAAAHAEVEILKDQIIGWLDDAKAEQTTTIDLAGKSSVGDYMIIASGRSDRHVGAIADQLQRKLKDAGLGNVHAEGQATCDWVLIDVGDIVIHVFRPEVREFYNLEKMWSADRPDEQASH
ncbi:MAG: ribosome silencing factor [Pseudomonadota bacterium]